MIVTINVNEQEARAIIAQWVANKHNMDIANINVLIGDGNTAIKSVEESYKSFRHSLIAKITELVPKSKIEAIKLFRTNTGAGLKESKFFVENASYWHDFIECGYIPTC